MGALGHGGWLVLAEPGLAALPVASVVGGVGVEVPQIQFIDAVIFEQLQFLDKFMVARRCATTAVVAHWGAVH